MVRTVITGWLKSGISSTPRPSVGHDAAEQQHTEDDDDERGSLDGDAGEVHGDGFFDGRGSLYRDTADPSARLMKPLVHHHIPGFQAGGTRSPSRRHWIPW